MQTPESETPSTCTWFVTLATVICSANSPQKSELLGSSGTKVGWQPRNRPELVVSCLSELNVSLNGGASADKKQNHFLQA